MTAVQIQVRPDVCGIVGTVVDPQVGLPNECEELVHPRPVADDERSRAKYQAKLS